MTGLERIRYTTSHPNDMTDGLIAAHGEVDKLMPFLHLPVQAGSDRILTAMNRSHSADSYLRVHRTRPRGAARHRDVGRFHRRLPRRDRGRFPGDARSDRRRRVTRMAYSFKYSRRPGTPAATMDDQIPAEVMDDRLQRLQALLNEQQQAFNEASVGSTTRRAARTQGQARRAS